MKYDFCGYATKNDLMCSDGRTIRHGAFKECDGETVPLVWSHSHGDVNNVLGHALLENRDDGVYAYGTFNDTQSGKNAKTMVEHGDITSLSIYANRLVQNGGDVVHGVIREVSLVLAGANPGAKIENVSFAHADGTVFDAEDEVIIHSGEEFEDVDGYLEHEDDDSDDMTVQDVFDSMTDLQRNTVYGIIGELLENGDLEHADEDDDDDETVQDVIDSMTDKQRNVMYGIIGELLSDEDEDEEDDEELAQSDGRNDMRKNVFDGSATDEGQLTLSHDEMKSVFEDAQKMGSLKNSVLAHATAYGIENIDTLFPDAKALSTTPEFLKRNTEWVDSVLNGAKHNPFSRIKTRYADITADEARAKGYIKGKLKKEEFFSVAGRVTTPQTIYKKQKLDRDDILDITEFDVVAWIKGEMRLMLNEEIARAVLIGDGRVSTDDDKINETNIRPIWKDHELYTTRVTLDKDYTPAVAEEQIIRALTYYEGTGTPTFFTTRDYLTDLMLMKDEFGRRYYKTKAELAEALGVSNIITVDVMKNQTRTAEVTVDGTEYNDTYTLYGIIVNMGDYTIGADRGGDISMFDDFDIDYNQYKYLLETRISGALTKLKSAIAVEILTEHEAA